MKSGRLRAAGCNYGRCSGVRAPPNDTHDGVSVVAVVVIVVRAVDVAMVVRIVRAGEQVILVDVVPGVGGVIVIVATLQFSADILPASGGSPRAEGGRGGRLAFAPAASQSVESSGVLFGAQPRGSDDRSLIPVPLQPGPNLGYDRLYVVPWLMAHRQTRARPPPPRRRLPGGPAGPDIEAHGNPHRGAKFNSG